VPVTTEVRRPLQERVAAWSAAMARPCAGAAAACELSVQLFPTV